MTHPNQPCKHNRDSWFDRTLCASDDWMHTYCADCGQPLDGDCGIALATKPDEGLDTLLASLDEADLIYDYPVSMAGEPMDPELFVRWDALTARLREGSPE